MKDRTQLPTQQQNPRVKAYALIGDDNDYTFLGDGVLQIATDSGIYQSQHYIQVGLEDSKQLFMRSRLSKKNNYERQKNTVILWNDPEQILSNSLALSFQNEQTCDMYWRVICSKIGKNYLQIHGRQKLEMPNQKNIKTFHQKMRSSYNLIAYHVIHSKQYMLAFWQTLQKLIIKKDPQLKAIQALRTIFHRFDPKIMEVFLVDPDFWKYLQFYGYEYKNDFITPYKKIGGVHQLIQLSPVANKRIEASLRAKYLRECVIDYSKDTIVQSMLSQILKDNQIQTLIKITHENAIKKLIELYNKSKQLMKQEKIQINRKIVAFLIQCVWILRIHHGIQIKMIFLNQFYKQGMLKVLGQILNQGNYKVLQILSCLAFMDKEGFQIQFANDYRNDSNSNLIRNICKQYSESKNKQIVDQTINFLRNLNTMIAGEKKMFQFFNKTLIFSIFSSCKVPQRILPLILICISQLDATKSIFEHIQKFKYFDTIMKKIKNKQLPKQCYLDILQIIKAVLEVNKIQKYGHNTEQTRKINSILINSGLFEAMLSLVKDLKIKNNLTISLVINIISIISGMKFTQFTIAIKDFDFGSTKELPLIKKYLQKINSIEDDFSPPKFGDFQNDVIKKRHHRALLEQQLQEQYLQQDQKQQQIKSKDVHETRPEEIITEDSMKKLLEMKEEIGNRAKQQEDSQRLVKQELKERQERLKAQKKINDTIGFSEEDLSDL